MEEITDGNSMNKFVTDEYLSSEDIILDEPLVDEDLQEIHSLDNSLVETLSTEENKTVRIVVNEEGMIPTSIMFALKNHMFMEKVVVLSMSLPGWKPLLSFFLSSYIDKIVLD